MHKLSRWCLVMTIMVAILINPEAAEAELPYRTFSYDIENGEFFVQPAYIPVGFIGFNIVSSADGTAPENLREPSDLFIDAQDHLYIADTKNDRIIHLDENHQLVKIIAEKDDSAPGKLKEPNGIFVNELNHIYVADTGNHRIAVFDADGEYLREYTRPQTTFLPEALVFEPTKLVVDKRGFLYVTINNGYEGLIVIDSDDGEFQGFFGANRVPFNLIDYLKRRVYTEQQLAKELTKRPGTVSNVTTDQDGLIYTTSISVEKGQIKKLNFSGKDLLGEKVYGDRYITLNEERLFIDVAVDRNGNMTGIDADSGIIYQYDPLGDLLFAFGGKNEGFNKMGLFGYPSSINVDSKGHLYVVDRLANMIQVFRPTEFADLVHKATELFMLGKYDESELPWKEVLHLNSKYYKAHLGLAKSYYRKGNWSESMAEFKEAGNVEGYSDAFWQVRLQFLQNHFGTIATSIIILTLGYWGWSIWDNKVRRRKQHGRISRTIKANSTNPQASD